jgi:hypothetical protein
MALINTSVPNLIQGVSQQPDATRFDGQCEEQENALSSVAEGLKKRPNTRHVARLLGEAIDADSFVHFINRSDSEKYVVIHDGSNLRAFNILTGNSATINGLSAFPISGTYLDSNPKLFKALTLGDNTILLNTSRITRETTNRTPVVSSEALIFVKQGDYGTKYGVSLQGNFTPTSGSQATASVSLSQSGSNYYINANPSIQQAGSGYEQGFVSITASSTGQIISQPTFNVIVNAQGGISNINLLNAGSFGPNQTGTQAISHNCTVNNYTETRNDDPYGNTQTFRKTVSFDLSITSGSTAHLTAGQTVTVITNNSNYLTVDNFGSSFVNYNQFTEQDINTFTGTLINSNTVRITETYAYTVWRLSSGSKYRGQRFSHDTGLSFNSGTSTNVASFTSQQPTYGAPAVTLSISSPTTSVNTARIDADITTPDGSNDEDFNSTGGLSGNGSRNDRQEIDTSVIANNLRKKLQSEISSASQTANFQVTNSNNLVVISANASSMIGYTISASDGLADTGLGVLYKEVGSISDLPLYCKNDFIIKVAGEQNEFVDDYYVKFQTNDGSAFGRGVWTETVGFNQPYELDSSTMPHLLVSISPDEFKLSAADGSTVTTAEGDSFTFNKWENKNAGDNETNPSPSFVEKPISNLLFFKNRVGFITESSVVLSESGQFFNFYRTTVSTLLDSAPIDVEVGSSKVTNLKASTPFQGNLLLFSDNEQFVLKGGDVLTPKTVSITAVTNFSFDAKVNPLSLGSYIYFPFNRGNFAGVREFNVNITTDTYDSVEITQHVPSYIYKDVIAMAGTTSEDMIALLSANEKGSLYIYNYFWNNNQKVLSAWSKFTFTGEIRGIEFIESTLYAVITNNGETNLVEMPLESGLKDNAGYVTHLDSRVSTTVDIGDNTITLPYTPEDNSVQVYTTDGLKLNCTNSGATVTLAQAVSADTDVWVGIPYTMKYTFSEQLFKAKAGNGKSPSNAAKMMIRNGSLYYADSAYFKVKVTPKYRDTYENVFTPDVVGSSTLGALSLDSGFYRFPVFTKPQDTTITIENESALPSTFQSAEFESFVHTRSNRYG